MAEFNFKNFLCGKSIPLGGRANTYCMLRRGHEEREGTKCTAYPPAPQPYTGPVCRHCTQPVETVHAGAEKMLIHTVNRTVRCDPNRLSSNKQEAEL